MVPGTFRLRLLHSYFHVELTNAYRKNELTPKLKMLREELLSALPEHLGFVYNKHDIHWAPCLVVTGDRMVLQGDSMGMDNDLEMLLKLRWLLSDVTETQGEWSESPLPVPHQGAASGACAMVSLSSIASFLERTLQVASGLINRRYDTSYTTARFKLKRIQLNVSGSGCPTFVQPSAR
ncbi:hypothetical protein B0H14DRAFT_2589613 [Mycena olivaceomarginata]|nr:hypothetical protein B0H14DRAFT_2589613 [Mycena olivaceomarginata]